MRTGLILILMAALMLPVMAQQPANPNAKTERLNI